MRLADLVLTEMRADGGIMSAYSLARLLSAKRRRRIAPNSVYRVLNELIEQSLVRRVESRNGFIALSSDSGAIIAICSTCGCVAWLDCGTVQGRLRQIAASAGFKPARQVIELVGSCDRCTRQAGLAA